MSIGEEVRGVWPSKIDKFPPAKPHGIAHGDVSGVDQSPCLEPVNSGHQKRVPRFDSALLLQCCKAGEMARKSIPQLDAHPLISKGCVAYIITSLRKSKARKLLKLKVMDDGLQIRLRRFDSDLGLHHSKAPQPFGLRGFFNARDFLQCSAAKGSWSMLARFGSTAHWILGFFASSGRIFPRRTLCFES